MRAASYNQFGEPKDVLKVIDMDKPEADIGEVVVRTIYSPIHNHDLWTIRGSYGIKPELPALAGSEAVGVVESVAPGGDETLVGKRVVAAGVLGTWADFFIAPASGLIPVPEEVSDVVASQLVAMPFSTITLLEFLDVKEGDWVIQTAANGTVGKLFIDMARERGLNVLNLVRREEAVQVVKDHGGEHVLSTDNPDWQNQAKTILGENGAQAAIDSVGGAVVAEVADLLGVDGLLVVFGSATGEPLQLNASKVISNHIVVKGFWGARIINEMPYEERARLMGELVSLASQQKLHLPSGGEYSVENIVEAVNASLTAGKEGKILVHP